MTTTLDFLIAVRTRLTPPSAWNQGAYVLVKEDGIRCWCLQGALYAEQVDGYTHEQANDRYGVMHNARTRLIEVNPEIEAYGLESWNDTTGRTHADVLNVLDDAILAEISNA